MSIPALQIAMLGVASPIAARVVAALGLVAGVAVTPPPPPPAPPAVSWRSSVMSSGDFLTLIAAKRQEIENDIDDETVCLLAAAVL